MTAIDIRGPVGPHELHARNYPQEIYTVCTASRHGTINAYKNHGCRCPIARRAWSRYMKDYRLRRLEGRAAHIDATGTTRRIRALQAIGWSGSELGTRLGCTAAAVSQLARRRLVRRDTAAKVCVLYNQLADICGPSRYDKTLAVARGWLPPIWWDDDLIDNPDHDPLALSVTPMSTDDSDEVKIERAIHGDPTVTLTRTEKTIALQQLLAAGHTKTEAARRLRLSGRTVNELAAAVTDGAQTVKRFGDLVSSPSSTAEEAS